MGFDAIIVGARCAGSPLAMLLARKGYRVLLVDRATFPSDTMSTHFVHQPGVEKLARWGLLGRVVASNCPPISKVALDLGPFVLTGSTTQEECAADAYAPRRQVLDKILVDAAVEAGAEVREGFSVDEVLSEGERVTGIRGRARGGATVLERAAVVVGADGMRSVVARALGAAPYNTRPALSCAYYSYWSDLPTEGAEVYMRPRRIVAAWPTHDQLVVILITAPREEFQQFRADVEGNCLRAIDGLPRLGARVREARRAARFRGTADLPNFFRKPYGLGWALVGDAGYHRDPVTGQGITDAFRDAELLAAAIDDGFSGRRAMAEALAGYEQQRNRAAAAMYRLTCHLAARQSPPGGRRMLRALCGNQAETDRFIGTLAGTTPITRFYSPANVRRLVGGGCDEPPDVAPAA